jgi:DNA polymerase-1
MLGHYLLEPDMRHNLNILSENLLGYKPIEIEELIGKKGNRQLNMRNIDPQKIAVYAGEDADLAMQLKKILWERLEKENLTELYYKLEEPLIKVLAQMEYEGVSINRQALNDYADEDCPRCQAHQNQAVLYQRGGADEVRRQASHSGKNTRFSLGQEIIINLR